MMRTAAQLSLIAGWALVAGAANAQGSPVKPPQAQAWTDVATFSGIGMPMGGMTGTAGSPMSALGGIFGGGSAAKNSFGQTQSGAPGRWVDVTLYSRNNPSLAEAQQAVPTGFLSPALKLQAARDTKAPPTPDDEAVDEPGYEKPEGKLLLYWGCGSAVRPGQPKVLDMASASAAELAAFFVSRRATQRGAHSAVGRPHGHPGHAGHGPLSRLAGSGTAPAAGGGPGRCLAQAHGPAQGHSWALRPVGLVRRKSDSLCWRGRLVAAALRIAP